MGRIAEWMVHMSGREGYDDIMEQAKSVVSLTDNIMGEDVAYQAALYPIAVKAAELRNVICNGNDASIRMRKRSELIQALTLIK